MLSPIDTTLSRSLLVSLTLAALLGGCATRSSQTASDSAEAEREETTSETAADRKPIDWASLQAPE